MRFTHVHHTKNKHPVPVQRYTAGSPVWYAMGACMNYGSFMTSLIDYGEYQPPFLCWRGTLPGIIVGYQLGARATALDVMGLFSGFLG